jgi:hypothetical protein
MSSFVVYVLYSWSKQVKVQRVWYASMDCTHQCIEEFVENIEAQPLGNLRRREDNSEIVHNTLRRCKLDLTDSEFCLTVLDLRGSTTDFLFTIFRCKLLVNFCYSSKRLIEQE